MTYEAHPLANIFPMIDDEAFPAFKADIEANGLIEPIILLEGKILDGRNRYKAITEIGDNGLLAWIEFDQYKKENGLDINPLDFVISKNMARRHLSESQRSMSAARATTMKQGERTDLKKGPLDNTEPSANLRNVSAGDAAKMFKVSERSVSSANRIINDGIERLNDLVDQGKVVVSVAEELARLAKDEQEKILAETKPEALKNAAKKASRNRKAKVLAEKQIALPDKKYGVIYADPEWDFETRSENGMSRSAANHYPLSPLAEIANRRVADIAADDCVLFLWATVPMLIEAFIVAEAWGFCSIERDATTGHLVIDKKKSRYVTNWDWLKHKISTGYWGRNQHEHLLIFTKGKPVAPALGTQPETVIHSDGKITPGLECGVIAHEKVRGHSEKPDIFGEWITRLFPDAPKIELNAREARDGWDVWGNEAPDETLAEASAKLPPRKVSSDDEIRDRLDARRLKAAAKEWPPQDVRYDGKHTDETDRVIEMGYALKKPITEICDALGIDHKQKGIIKGRASRAGWTDKARIAENNKARKGK